jgi:ribonuclease P protein component
MKFRFKKSERLGGDKRIELLFKNGNHLFSYPFKVAWSARLAENLVPIRIGIGVSKKSIRQAVQRNLVKRRIRECYRIQKEIISHEITDTNYQLEIMLIYVAKEVLQYQVISTRLLICIKKIAEDLRKQKQIKGDLLNTESKAEV